MLVLSLFLPATGIGQTLTDTVMILQNCIDLPELEELIPINESGQAEQLYVVQYPVAFSPTIEIRKGETGIPFIERSDLSDTKVKAYFMFREFNLSGDEANINMNFFYRDDTDPAMMNSRRMILELRKDGSDWHVVTKK